MSVDHLAKLEIKIEYANGDHFLAKGIKKIRLSYLKKYGSTSLITINDILYIPEAKANLLSLD